MRYFIDYPWHFHWDFLSYCLAISMDISLFIPITFIAIFIHIPCRYYWIFHCLSLPISLRFSLLFQCDIIGYFILYLWYYLCDFILIPRRFFFSALFICLVLMWSKHNTCDLFFASIYIFIAQLIHIMASNPNKYKDQGPGVARPGKSHIFGNIYYSKALKCTQQLMRELWKNLMK